MNIDPRTVDAFGAEWAHFDQSRLPSEEHMKLFLAYFKVFPWEAISRHAIGFDMGCGSGRWAMLVAPRVGSLHCIDASQKALDTARRNLSSFDNCHFHEASVDTVPLKGDTMDFGYSLGVLHHLPDPESGLRSCVRLLKQGAPFLLYIYYSFDNRPMWYRALWGVTDRLRRLIVPLPARPKRIITDAIALMVYLPLARLARGFERTGRDVTKIPLSHYRRLSFYTMRTDALDRFGTRLEQRFTRDEIESMMQRCGLGNVRFSDEPPYWCAVGYKQ